MKQVGAVYIIANKRNGTLYTGVTPDFGNASPKTVTHIL